ncbi:MAG: M24 family metallopeptidase [Candidatus Limnocylindria bacterium]
MTLLAPSSARFSTSVYADRLRSAAHEAARRDVAALLITPSPDYTYLLGYAAPALERITCLIVPADGRPTLVLPRFEQPLAVGELGDLAAELDLVTWDETDDPCRLIAQSVGGTARRVAVEDHMVARFVLRLRAAMREAELVEAGPMMAALRRRKRPEEIERLRAAGEAADAAMLSITRERFVGRAEREIHARIAELLVEAGHERADHAIVGTGPNSASPHHAPADRRVEVGDAIVLDIGGTRDGYRSDTTRMAFAGEPPEEFLALYRVLQAAQQSAFEAVQPGIAARDIDRAARSVIEDAGYGDWFIHRTGHGIGLEGHEEPYIVASNEEPIEAGDAFSIEPGIYIDGRWGARIEDIVVCTDTGGDRLNRSSRELYLVE